MEGVSASSLASASALATLGNLASPNVWAPALALAAAGGVAWRERRGVPWGLLAAGCAFQAACAVVFALILASRLGERPWLPDEALYEAQTERVARAWAAGEFPPLSDGPWLGSLHTGYERAGAALVLATGGGARTCLLALNAAALAGALLLFALLAEGLYSVEGERGRASSWRALAWFALFPSSALWATVALRDALHLFVLLLSWLLWAEFWRPEASRGRRAIVAAGAAGAMWWLFSLRFYSALFWAGSCALWALVCLPRSGRRSLAWGAGLLALGGCVAALPWTRRLLAPALGSFAALASERLGAASLAEWVLAAPRLLLGPYGWARLEEFSIGLLLYPGQWMLYLGLLPAALASGWGWARRFLDAGLLAEGCRAEAERLRARPLAALVPFFAATGLALMIAHGGHADRQWHPWVAGLCLLAPSGWRELRSLWARGEAVKAATR